MDEDLFNAILSALLFAMSKMTTEQRVRVFACIKGPYCNYCGGEEGNRCQCWNDE